MNQVKDTCALNLANTNSKISNFCEYKTSKVFSNFKLRGFSLLSSGISKALIKSNITIINAKQGSLSLDDPLILLSLDLIGKSKNIFIYTSDLLEEELVAKLILSLSGLNEAVLKKGVLLEDSKELDFFEKASNIIFSSKLKFAKGSILSSFWQELKALKETNCLDLVIIDDIESLSIGEQSMQELLEHFNKLSETIGVKLVLISRT
jgi:hypothetical protein